MWRHTSALLATIAISASPVLAKTMRTFTVGNWSAGAYSNDNTHQFDHCAGSATYKSGITAGFSIGSTFSWSMAFLHPAWHLQPGAVFDIAFTVDDMSPIAAHARAISGNMVQVPLINSTELFARFRRGKMLRVAAANQIFSFSLTDTSQLLPVLLACAQNRGAVVRIASNPFAPPSSNSASGATDESKEIAEATTYAANLLSSAGVQGFTFLTPAEYPDFKGQARWVQGTTVGTLNIFQKATADELKKLPAYLIGADAKSCNGTFLSGAIPDEIGAIARVFTTCQKKAGKPVTVYYLAIPRSNGGAYVISTISIGSEKPAKDTDATLRAAVFKVSQQPASHAGN